MKKSKILIPAFAILALSVGASVTGTVAWFTANRTQSFTSTFGIKDSEGAMIITSEANANAGTKVESDKNIIVDGNLTHGSYNALNDMSGHLYVAKITENPNNVDKPYEINGYVDHNSIPDKNGDAVNVTQSEWLASSSADNKLWYGVSWESTFTLNNGGIKGNNHLFLDIKNSTLGASYKEGTAHDGFRIAIMGKTNDTEKTEALVLGADKVKDHVNGTTAESHDDFKEFYHSFGDTYKSAIDDDTVTSYKANDGYIGAFPENNTIKLTFVAWFEGQDAHVISNTANSSLAAITANLTFYARRTTKTA